MTTSKITVDANEAVARVVHKINEVCAIYPITPSSTMGELVDEYSSDGKKNIWGMVPTVIEMQSEAGAAGTVHGSLQAGALTTTFTASQGLLLMIPNMFKIAGEFLPTVFHVTARTIATHALSIFGDHSDVMATRSTGWGMWAAGSVQEAQDFALMTQAATLESRVPIVHFFDGFRTSHEVQKIDALNDDIIRTMIDDDLVVSLRDRALSPDKPKLAGSAQNPDVFFQAREAGNPFYDNATKIYQKIMDRFAKLTDRSYHLFDYVGAADADQVIVIMGSGAEVVHETVDALNHKGLRLGVVKVRVYRPFDSAAFVAAIPSTVRVVTVMDRTKEPGALGDPLYTDVVTALYQQQRNVKVLAGRYGLSSKEFTPAMVKSIFDNGAATNHKKHFTIGIHDDVTHTSLDYDKDFSVEPDDVFRALFWGLGADGTVGANKNSIKIIGEGTESFVQGYFVYDSKKSGSSTVSHLRFGPRPIRSSYLVTQAHFIACHQSIFLERYDILEAARPNATFLINTTTPPEKIWDFLPRCYQEHLIHKKIKLYVIDAYKVARATGMGGRINTIMQTCFFAISGVLPSDVAITKIKESIDKTYGKKGADVVKQNHDAVDKTLEGLKPVKIPTEISSQIEMRPAVTKDAPAYVRDVLGKIISLKGDELPVSAFSPDGSFPTGTSRYEKRNLAREIPVWDTALCIQCAKCALVCPHAAIRIKIYDTDKIASAPETFKHAVAKGGKDFAGMSCTIQVAPEDCTGCAVCVEACPAVDKNDAQHKAIDMKEQEPLRLNESANFDYFLKLKSIERNKIKIGTVKGSQMIAPLFEFSGACTGCGETPYIMLLTQLFGDRALIANATGCSSIFGGNLPTTPYATNEAGLGPAWANSLFEDNAEFGLGFRLTADRHRTQAGQLVSHFSKEIGDDLATKLLNNPQVSPEEIDTQWKNLGLLREKLPTLPPTPEAMHLKSLANYLVKKSVWIVGGDGWAYDIGYGGLDHVLASGHNVNVLVLDTGVYSNTGGQCSKSTPFGAVAKFASGGKPMMRKDLGLMTMMYGNIYVAQVALGANDNQVVKAFVEAEAYDGPSLIIAYSHCIAHGIEIRHGLDQQAKAVDSGFWPLYRYNPSLRDANKNPFKLDSKPPSITYDDWALSESRFKMLQRSHPEESKKLLASASIENSRRWEFFSHLEGLNEPKN